MINEHDIELVESYLEGKLEGKDLEAFKEREANDPEFARFIQVRIMIGDAWTSAADYLEAKQWVKETINNHVQTKSRFNNKTIWFSLAAIILILIGVFVIMKIATKNADDQPAYASDTTQVEIDINQSGPPDQKAGIDTVFTFPVLTGMINNETYTVSDSLVFTWESNVSYSELIIALQSNDSIINTEALDAGQTKFVLMAGLLKPGLYYWCLDKPLVKAYFIIVEE